MGILIGRIEFTGYQAKNTKEHTIVDQRISTHAHIDI